MVGGLEAGGLEAVRRPMTATLALVGSRAVRKSRAVQLEVRTGAVRARCGHPGECRRNSGSDARPHAGWVSLAGREQA
jgi:hypothetical protein